MTVYSVSLLTWDNQPQESNANKPTTFTRFFKSQCNTTLPSILSEITHPSPVLVIIDEAQAMYALPESDITWRMIKNHMNANTRKAPHVLLLLLAAYNESPQRSNVIQNIGTPIAFRTVFGIDFLSLTEAEFADLIGRFDATQYGTVVHLSSDIRRYIYTFTGGHIGLTCHTVAAIGEKFYSRSKSARSVSDRDITGYLLNRVFHGIIKQNRSITVVLRVATITGRRHRCTIGSKSGRGKASRRLFDSSCSFNTQFCWPACFSLTINPRSCDEHAL